MRVFRFVASGIEEVGHYIDAEGISQIFLKLDLRESAEDHRRVLAVLAFLRSG
jgi:hypothetical protein